eukprot:IDg15873t1
MRASQACRLHNTQPISSTAQPHACKPDRIDVISVVRTQPSITDAQTQRKECEPNIRTVRVLSQRANSAPIAHRHERAAALALRATTAAAARLPLRRSAPAAAAHTPKASAHARKRRGAMDALREMFPARGESALAGALAASNGDVAAAAERLLPPADHVARDEALARSLQMAEMPAPRAQPSWADAAQPVVDALAAAAEAARAAVQYVVDEVSAAAAAAAAPDVAPPRRGASSAADARPPDAAATVVTARASGPSAGVHLRSTRSQGRSNTPIKKDD